MEPPPGAFQRAVLVSVPLVLVLMVVVTPVLIGRERSPTAIPFLLVELYGQGENETENETVLLYVQSALAVTRYSYLAINVTGEGEYSGTNWSAEGRDVPSLVLRYPAVAMREANVTAVAIEEDGTFRLNLTLELAPEEDGTLLRVRLEGATDYRDSARRYSASMRREATP